MLCRASDLSEKLFDRTGDDSGSLDETNAMTNAIKESPAPDIWLSVFAEANGLQALTVWTLPKPYSFPCLPNSDDRAMKTHLPLEFGWLVAAKGR